MEVQGFAFEPEYPAGIEPQHPPPNPTQHEDPGQARGDERTGNVNVEWSQCSYCQAMPTAKESFCCQEHHKAKEKMPYGRTSQKRMAYMKDIMMLRLNKKKI